MLHKIKTAWFAVAAASVAAPTAGLHFTPDVFSALEEKGVQKVEIDPAVIAEFRAIAAEPARDAWIADMEAQGLPGQELYDLVISTLEKERASN